jgi:hypothetical protein
LGDVITSGNPEASIVALNDVGFTGVVQAKLSVGRESRTVCLKVVVGEKPSSTYTLLFRN